MTQEKEKYQRPLKQKYMKLEEPVDENTVIPEMPKEILKEPNFDEFRSKCKKLKDQKGDLGKELKTFIENTISTIKSKKSQTRLSVAPLNEELDNKLKKYREIKSEFEQARQVLEQKKASFDQQHETCEQIKLKMKANQGSVKQIEAEIQNLKEILSDAKVSVKQEKDMVQKISQLELVLPYAAKNDEAQKILKEKITEKKEAQSSYFKLKEESTSLKNQIGKIRDTINEMSNMTAEEQQQVQPLIDAKKEEINKKIEKINETLEKLNLKFDQDKVDYQQQKKLIERIEWMQKEKRAFIKNKKEEEKQKALKAKREQELEDERLRKEAEEKELAQDPYDENVSICTLLEDYCKKLQPKQTQKSQMEDEKQKVDVSKILEQKEWKKDNVTLVVSKKSLDQEENKPLGKKQKNKRKENSEKAREDSLQHNLEILNYFEHIKISPPLFTKQLEETLNLLQEKKEYFQNLPKEQKENNAMKTKVLKERQVNKKQQAPADFQESSFPSL